EAPGPVPPRDREHVSLRCDPPEAVVLGADERCEAGGRVEARETRPVDRPVGSDEHSRMQIADQAVVLDAKRHPPAPPTVACAYARRLTHKPPFGNSGWTKEMNAA